MADQFGIVRNRQRPTGQITLHLVAAFPHQGRVLGVSFDAFGQDRNVEAVAETDDRTNNRHGMAAVFQVANKSAVNLDLIERERMQIGQGRIPGSEIIQCDPHAERLEPSENRYRARKIVNQYALGDFKFETSRSEAGLKQDRMDQARQVALAELNRRNVNLSLIHISEPTRRTPI